MNPCPLNPCPLNPSSPRAPHRWTWVRNMPTGATFHHRAAPPRGLYQCACGASRIGAANSQTGRNGPMRDILGALAISAVLALPLIYDYIMRP